MTNFSLLLLSGDVELNPGPSSFPSKVVTGTFHQGDPRFGVTAGTQCLCNSIWSVCFFSTKALRFCTSRDLDTVLTLGNDSGMSMNT